jgi:hypothetical protein
MAELAPAHVAIQLVQPQEASNTSLILEITTLVNEVYLEGEAGFMSRAVSVQTRQKSRRAFNPAKFTLLSKMAQPSALYNCTSKNQKIRLAAKN